MILDSYAKSHGWSIYEHYIDEDWSGSNRSRPEFHRMISDAQNGKFDIVLVKTQSRFARDSKFIEDYIHNLFAEKGIRFISVVDNIDTSIRGSKLNSRMHAIFDEEQLDLLSSNIRRSFEEKARQGQFFGSMPPYGYKKDPHNKNHLIIDEEAAAVVRMIFEMTAAGASYTQIASTLNNGGYLIPSEYKKNHGYKVDGMYDRYPSSHEWTRDIIRSFLSNEVYTGTVINRKSTVVNFRTGKKKNLPQSFHIKCPGMHEAIIDKALWDKVQGIKSSRRKPSTDSTIHPLSGSVICGVCGSKMYKCNSGKISYFRCGRAASGKACTNRKRIRTEVLEACIITTLNEILMSYADADCLKQCMAKNTSVYTRLDKTLLQRENIKKSIEDIRKNIKQLLAGYISNTIDKSLYEEAQLDYLAEKERYEKQLELTDTEIRRLENEISEHNNADDIIKAYLPIEKLTFLLVREFIEAVEVGEVLKEREINIRMKI